jgi:hypothetical protein
MSDYEITCVTKTARTAGHQHIIEVGVKGESKPLTVPDVYTRMHRADIFYTVSPSSGDIAFVHKDECCGIATLRSHSDAVRDNNLDNLRACG